MKHFLPRKTTGGNYLCLTLKVVSITVTLMTLYTPYRDSPSFYPKIQETVQGHNSDYSICGDYNLPLKTALDTDGYKHVNNPKARLAV